MVKRTWVGIGSRAGRALRERDLDVVEEVPGVHGALHRLGRRDVDGVLADPLLLVPRREQALALLRRQLDGAPLEILGETAPPASPEPPKRPEARVERAPAPPPPPAPPVVVRSEFEAGCLERLGDAPKLKAWVLEEVRRRLDATAVRIAPCQRPLERPQTGLRDRTGYVRIPLGERHHVHATGVSEAAREDRAGLRALEHVGRDAGRALDVTLDLERSRELASVDALTGLPNRRTFDAHLARQAGIFQRTGAPYALVMMDLDHFHDVNHRFGFLGGDDVLRTVAERLRASFRETDIVARWGGEEFVALLAPIEPGSQDSVFEAADRARIRVKRPLRTRTGADHAQTLTGGLVICPDHGTDPEQLLALASQLCIQGKDDGRDGMLKPEP